MPKTWQSFWPTVGELADADAKQQPTYDINRTVFNPSAAQASRIYLDCSGSMVGAKHATLVDNLIAEHPKNLYGFNTEVFQIYNAKDAEADAGTLWQPVMGHILTHPWGQIVVITDNLAGPHLGGVGRWTSPSTDKDLWDWFCKKVTILDIKDVMQEAPEPEPVQSTDPLRESVDKLIEALLPMVGQAKNQPVIDAAKTVVGAFKKDAVGWYGLPGWQQAMTDLEQALKGQS